MAVPGPPKCKAQPKAARRAPKCSRPSSKFAGRDSAPAGQAFPHSVAENLDALPLRAPGVPALWKKWGRRAGPARGGRLVHGRARWFSRSANHGMLAGICIGKFTFSPKHRWNEGRQTAEVSGTRAQRSAADLPMGYPMRSFAVTFRQWFSLLGAALALGSRAWAGDWTIYRFEGPGLPVTGRSRRILRVSRSASDRRQNLPPAGSATSHLADTDRRRRGRRTQSSPGKSSRRRRRHHAGQWQKSADSRPQQPSGPDRRSQPMAGLCPRGAGRQAAGSPRLDLSKTIEPRLRPDKAAGLEPVFTVVLGFRPRRARSRGRLGVMDSA